MVVVIWDKQREKGVLVKSIILEPSSTKNILLLRTDNLGDLVLSLPAIFSLKKELPNSRLTLLVNKKNKGLVELLPYVDKIIAVDFNNLYLLVKVFVEIIRNHFDIAIQLYTGNSLKEAILIFFSGAKYRLGYSQGLSRFFFTNNASINLNQSELQNVISIIKNFIPGLKFTSRGLETCYSGNEQTSSLFKKYGVRDGSNIIVLHPVSSIKDKNKMWPIGRYKDLVSKITAIFNKKVFVIGTKEEKEIIETVVESCGNAFNLAGELKFADLISLIGNSCLFIGNNSGPLQIAVALDIPTVSLMGPSLYKRWAPQSEKHIVIRKKIDCIPCEGKKQRCLDNICMKMISVDEVFDAVELQLKQNPVNCVSSK